MHRDQARSRAVEYAREFVAVITQICGAIEISATEKMSGHSCDAVPVLGNGQCMFGDDESVLIGVNVVPG